MAQSLPFDLTKILLAEQAKLKGMPGLSKQISEFQQQPDPIEQKMKELELAKLDSEINERNSRVGENHVDARLKEAKAVNEEAKARMTHSSADMTDLDFLRKQEGVDFDEKMSEEEAKGAANARAAEHKETLDYMSKSAIQREPTNNGNNGSK